MTPSAWKPVDESAWKPVAETAPQQQRSQTTAEKYGVTNPIGKGALDLLEGVGAGVMSTVRGASQLAHKAIPAVPVINEGYAQAPESLAGKAGKFAEQAGEFALPIAGVSKATHGASLLLRAGAEGLASGGVAAVQSGGDPMATAVGAATGAAGPVLGKAASAVASKAGLSPEKLYQSALKPTWAMAKKDGLEMVKTGLKEKVPVSQEGLRVIQQRIDDIGKDISSGVQLRAMQGRTIDTSKVLSTLDDLEKFYRNSGSPERPLKQLADLRLEFEQYHGQHIPLDKAQQIKQNTYQLIKDSYGEMATAKIEGLKQIARGLKDQISSVFPEVAGMNERQSKLLGLDEAMTRALWRIENHQIMGIGSPIAASAGGAIMGGPGAVASLVGKFVLDDPSIKSKLAIALANKGVKAAPAVVNARMAALKGSIESISSKMATGDAASLPAAAQGRPSGQSELTASVREAQ